MSSDGLAISASMWEENSHNISLYNATTGYVYGERTGNAGPGSNGTNGTAVDSPYIYSADGNGQVFRFSRSAWTNAQNLADYDNGSKSGVGPLTVDSGGHPLLGMTFATASSMSRIQTGRSGTAATNPLALTQVKICAHVFEQGHRLLSAPGARSLTCDRKGDIWVLIQATGTGQTMSMPAKAERFSSSGTLLSSFTFPASVIPYGIAADPTQDRLSSR